MLFFAAWFWMTLTLAGCSTRSSDVADVRGVVTLGGQPLVAATVLFQPAQGRASVGLYTPRELGARIGPCRVRISTASDDDGKISPSERVPRRYFEPGALAAEVKAGDNVVDFHLETSP